jgi:hypothetical protein
MENTLVNKDRVIVSEMWELIFQFDDVIDTLKMKSLFISDFFSEMRRKCECPTEFKNCKEEAAKEIEKWSKAENIDQITKLYDSIAELMTKLKK